VTFIEFIASFLRKNTGYLYQNPELAKKINLNFSTDEWQQRCVDTHQRLNNIRKGIVRAKKSGSSEFRLGRDPEEAIADILNLKNPLSVTMRMTKNMLADIEKLYISELEQAVLYRDTLLLIMLQANPLRARMFKRIELNENLIKEKDGSWWLQFNRKDFKNRQVIDKNYKVRLARNIWCLIERYLEEFRPVLLRGKEVDLVFVNPFEPYRAAKLRDPKLNYINIYQISRRRTRQYLSDSMGFGPHSFRHIIATSIIKKNPETGFYLAAQVLHNKIETVMRNYAHLKTSEMFEPYSNLFDENWKNTDFNNPGSHTNTH
jgi:integrase